MDLDDVHSRQIVAGTLIAFKPRKTNRKLRSDDICFQCGCAGELIQCDDCPRVFHLECISNLDNIPEGAWRCPWHSCYSCGNEAETALDPGYYCVHCPTSYCSVCAANSSGHDSVSLRIFATLFPPDVNTFSSLRRSGFTLQNPSSLLFVCPKCTSNTEGAVCEMYRPVNGSADLKKVPFKISTAMMHKKLLRSFSALPSKYSHQNKSIDFMKIRGSYAETPVDSSVVCLNEIESDLNDKLLVQIKEQNEIDMRKTETCTDVSTLALSEAQQARSNSISSDTTAVVTTNQSSGDVDECAQPVSPTEISRQVSEAVNPTVSTDTTSMSSSSRTNMLDHPAVRKFFSSPNAGSLCKMRAKGWTFLYPFPISESFQAPNSQLAHKLVGCRCRRYFTGYGKSDGVLVAHLAGKRNEGLTLLHCVHDDGDEEDLDEEEAATAASDFNTDCKTKSESNKMRLARKHQLDLEVQALVRAQGETQVVRAATTLSRAAVLAEACKRAPVECIGYYMTAAIPSSVDDISLTTTPSKTPDTPSAQTAVVLKRFSNAREAATLMMRSVADSSAPAELTSDTGVSVSVPQTQSEGGGASVGSGKKDSTTDGGSEVAERVRLSAWWKEILRCCRGQRAYFLGLKWQFAFPRLVGLLPGSTDDHQHNPDRTDSQNRETLSDEGDAVNRAGAVRGADDCDSSIAASLQRRIRTRVPSVASQTSEHDAFSLLRAECSQSQGHMDSLQNVDLPLRDLIGVVIEHLSDSDSSDEDREETESEEEMETKKEDFLSPSRTKIASPRNSSRRPRNRRPQTTQKDEGMERKFPSLGATFQAEVPSLPQAPGAEGEGESCHEGSRCVWSSSSPHVLPSGASLESPSRINDVSVHSTPVSRAKPSGAPLERDTVDRGGPAFDERSIPCYWAQESRIALLNGNQAAPTASKSSNPSSASKPRTVSDDEQTALDELVDRTLYAAMLAQYLPGMVVTYIKGAEAEGKAAGPETGSSGPYKSKEDRDKDRERDRGEDYLHTNRSSKRISMVTGAGVKSARFGCVVRGPFFPNGSSSLTPSVCGAAAVVLDPDLPSSSSATSDGTPVTFKPQAPSFLRQAMMTLYTGLLDEVVTVPCVSCCRVVPDDEVLYLLKQTQNSFDTTILRVGKLASNLLYAQWSESDVSAMFDSGYVHSGNVRGLVVHMKTHRIGIRADQTIYFYSRLRKDHIVMNGGDYSDMLGPPDSSGLSASSSSTKAKEREKEKDALSNPTHVVLAEYLKKQLSKDRPTVCAVFRYADQLLGREDGSAGILDRKPHIAHKGAAAAPRRAAVPPSAPVPPVDASSSSQHIHADAAVSSGSSSSSSISSHSSGTKGKNHVDAAGTSANGSGSGSNGNDIGMDGTNGSNTAVSKTAKRPLPILSLLGIINENPPPVDMTRFLQIFLNKPDEPGIKRPRTS